MKIGKLVYPLAGLAITASALGATGVIAADAASYGVTFSASSDGSMAVWYGPQELEVQLHVATAAGFAQMSVKGIEAGSAAPASAPTLTVTSYAAGTPRLEIVPNNGNGDSLANDVTGYPSPSLCGQTTGICWALPATPNTYTATWADVQSYLGSNGGVSQVYVVADGSQATPYDSFVTQFSWAGQQLVPAPRFARVRDAMCGETSTARTWIAGDSGTVAAHVRIKVATRVNGHLVWRVFRRRDAIDVGKASTWNTHRRVVKFRIFYLRSGKLPATYKGALTATATASRHKVGACPI